MWLYITPIFTNFKRYFIIYHNIFSDVLGFISGAFIHQTIKVQKSIQSENNYYQIYLIPRLFNGMDIYTATFKENCLSKNSINFQLF